MPSIAKETTMKARSEGARLKAADVEPCRFGQPQRSKFVRWVLKAETHRLRPEGLLLRGALRKNR